MAVPATTGQLRERVEDMELGDYIKCGAVRGSTMANTVVYNFGSGAPASSGEIPVSGLGTTAGLGGTFYFVKVDKGLLIADRVIFNSITWDQLNSKQWIEGVPFESGSIRSLSGGVLYSDSNGNKSNADLGYGAFPSINEWDKYIMKSNLGSKATPNDDNVWHHHNVFCWAKETPALGSWTTNKGTALSATSSSRIVRGFEKRDDNRGVAFTGSSASQSYIGFRPVFEYKEV